MKIRVNPNNKITAIPKRNGVIYVIDLTPPQINKFIKSKL
jgi:hypothetical protein